MKITERQLRRIIREALDSKLDEMAWGGHIGVVRSNKPKSEFSDGGGNAYVANPAAAEKFSKSAAFAEKATTLYDNLPFRVFTAPFIGNIDDPEIANVGGPRHQFPRRDVFPLNDQVLENLRVAGYTIPADIGPTDLIILYTSAGAEGKKFSSSPWIIFHAIFNGDSFDKEIGKLSPSYIKLLSFYDDPDPDDPLYPLVSTAEDKITDYFTMGAARSKELSSGFIESMAEAISQELLDRRGLFFRKKSREETPPEDVAALAELKRRIAICAKEARQNMMGKLIIVDVS